MSDLAVALAEAVHATTYDGLSAEAIVASKKLISSTLGLSLAGLREHGIPEVAALFDSFGAHPQATVLGTPIRTIAPLAAYVNAASASAYDFDDNFDPSSVHTGVTVVSAAFATAETHGPASGKDLITAVAAGADVICRLAIARRLEEDAENPWSSTAVLGYFGASAAVAKLLGLDADGIENAMGIAYTAASGNRQSIYEGVVTKALQMGETAKSAVLAGLLSQRGIHGPRDAVEGRAGLFNCFYRGRAEPAAALDRLGEECYVEHVGIKPYPSGRHIHGYIDCVLEILETGIVADDVDTIRATVYPTNRIVWHPEAIKKAPRSSISAEFSLQYGLATTVLRGRPTLDHYTPEAVLDPQVQQLTTRVECHPAQLDTHDETGGKVQASEVEIILHNGHREHARTDIAKGAPGNTMTEHEVANKFRGCATFGATLTTTHIEDAITTLHHLEHHDVTTLAHLLATD